MIEAPKKVVYANLYFARADLKRYARELLSEVTELLNDIDQGAKVSKNHFVLRLGTAFTRMMTSIGEVAGLERPERKDDEQT